MQSKESIFQNPYNHSGFPTTEEVKEKKKKETQKLKKRKIIEESMNSVSGFIDVTEVWMTDFPVLYFTAYI